MKMLFTCQLGNFERRDCLYLIYIFLETNFRNKRNFIVIIIMDKFLRPAGSKRLLASPSDCVFKNCYSVCSSVILSLKTSYSVFVNVLLCL